MTRYKPNTNVLVDELQTESFHSLRTHFSIAAQRFCDDLFLFDKEIMFWNIFR